MRSRREEGNKYVTVSIPVAIAKDMDALMQEIGYWPSRGAFVREACIEKIERKGNKGDNDAKS